MSAKRRRLVLDPPSPLSPPRLPTLAADQALLHRTFDGAYAPNAFNPGKGRRTRFAPIKAADGTHIPTLYAGESIECAFYESVLHDVPVEGDDRVIAYSALLDRQYAALRPTRDLTLAQWFTPDLKQWHLERSQLIDTRAFHYRDTARWAEALHTTLPAIDGLVWTSRQDDEHHAYLLFGDRLDAAQLIIVDGPSEIVNNVALFTRLRACAHTMAPASANRIRQECRHERSPCEVRSSAAVSLTSGSSPSKWGAGLAQRSYSAVDLQVAGVLRT